MLLEEQQQLVELISETRTISAHEADPDAIRRCLSAMETYIKLLMNKGTSRLFSSLIFIQLLHCLVHLDSGKRSAADIITKICLAIDHAGKKKKSKKDIAENSELYREGISHIVNLIHELFMSFPPHISGSVEVGLEIVDSLLDICVNQKIESSKHLSNF
jgi:hypothetical protein